MRALCGVCAHVNWRSHLFWPICFLGPGDFGNLTDFAKINSIYPFLDRNTVFRINWKQIVAFVPIPNDGNIYFGKKNTFSDTDLQYWYNNGSKIAPSNTHTMRNATNWIEFHGFWCNFGGFELIESEIAFFVPCELTYRFNFREMAFLGGAILGSLRRICALLIAFMPF